MLWGEKVMRWRCIYEGYVLDRDVRKNGGHLWALNGRYIYFSIFYNIVECIFYDIVEWFSLICHLYVDVGMVDWVILKPPVSLWVDCFSLCSCSNIYVKLKVSVYATSVAKLN